MGCSATPRTCCFQFLSPRSRPFQSRLESTYFALRHINLDPRTSPDVLNTKISHHRQGEFVLIRVSSVLVKCVQVHWLVLLCPFRPQTLPMLVEPLKRMVGFPDVEFPTLKFEDVDVHHQPTSSGQELPLSLRPPMRTSDVSGIWCSHANSFTMRQASSMPS